MGSKELEKMMGTYRLTSVLHSIYIVLGSRIYVTHSVWGPDRG